MFDGLQGKLQAVFRDLRGEGRITPAVLEEALKQIRMALLEADVHFRVVKAFVDRVRERSSSEEVLASLTGSQQVVKIVRDELVALLGDEGAELRLDGRPAVVLLCGLQGSGKTTTAGKLAKRLNQRGRHPLLVAGDLQRAAAVEQLVQVGRGVGVPVVTPEAGEKVEALAERALKVARDRGNDVVVFDTAGRLHVDEALMAEVKRLADRLKPSETLFVADAMTGQDAVKSAGAFAAVLPLTGAILTKLDGDSRGGAALSIRTVAKVPIRFAGTGEKSDDLELFQPERMASRILGMGDVLSLIERAERELDQGETERFADRFARSQLTLEDLRDQMRQIRKLGSMSQILEMLPKVGPLRGLDSMKVDDGQLKRVEAIVDSMTPLERRRPQVLDGSRKKRIAGGSGTQVQEINQLLKQYQQMQKMLKGGQGKMLRRMMQRRGA
ncbi:MAG TPA: signal recognition particle protein [Thermoanaerobaculia bacterium]|nr:signal recognition particle protein [Thermoanaerobaculia bacterium]